MKKSLYLLMALGLVVVIARPLMVADAQTSTVDVALQIDELTALNLGEDGLFDDKIDEVVVYYGITEIDPDGDEVDSTYGTFEGNFAADDSQTEFLPVVLNVDPRNQVVISVVMVEVDNGSFDLTDYLGSGVYSSDPEISQACTLAALSSVLGLITGGGDLTDPSLGGGLVACLGDVDQFVLLFTSGNDDLYSPFSATYEAGELVSGYVEAATTVLDWAGLTNRSQYELSYTLSVE